LPPTDDSGCFLTLLPRLDLVLCPPFGDPLLLLFHFALFDSFINGSGTAELSTFFRKFFIVFFTSIHGFVASGDTELEDDSNGQDDADVTAPFMIGP
jgi:hypothetical protein